MILGPDGRVHVARGAMQKAVGDQIKADVRKLLTDCYNDQVLHATIVAAGRTNFRAAFTKDMGAYFGMHRAPCDDLANSMFAMLSKEWKRLYPDMGPEFFLDHVEVKSPESEKDIEDAWELEIASDERTLNQYYEGSARVRKGTDFGARTTPLKKVH